LTTYPLYPIFPQEKVIRRIAGEKLEEKMKGTKIWNNQEIVPIMRFVKT
jgi:hypothetical protein